MAWKKKDNSKLKLKAKKLRAKGMGYTEIGKIIGRNKSVIRYWLDPEYHKSQNKHILARNQNLYEEDRQFRKKMIDSNIKSIMKKKKYCKTFQKKLKIYENKRHKLISKLIKSKQFKDKKHKFCIFCKSKRIIYYGYDLHKLENKLIIRYRCKMCKRTFL